MQRIPFEDLIDVRLVILGQALFLRRSRAAEFSGLWPYLVKPNGSLHFLRMSSLFRLWINALNSGLGLELLAHFIDLIVIHDMTFFDKAIRIL